MSVAPTAIIMYRRTMPLDNSIYQHSSSPTGPCDGHCFRNDVVKAVWHASNCSKLEGRRKRYEIEVVVSAITWTRKNLSQETLLVSMQRPDSQAMCPTTVREGSNQAGGFMSGMNGSCAWAAGEQSLDWALRDLAFRSLRCSGASRLQPHLSGSTQTGAHEQGKLRHRRLRQCSRQYDGDSFHRAVDSFSNATGSTVRDHLILQAAAPCAPKLGCRISGAAQQWRATPRFRDRARYVQDIKGVEVRACLWSSEDCL